MYSQPSFEERQSFQRVGDIFRYFVRPGDHLMSIARRFNTSAQLIQGLNRLPNNSILRVGQELLIPVLFRPPLMIPREEDSQTTYSSNYF